MIELSMILHISEAELARDVRAVLEKIEREDTIPSRL